MHRKKLLASLIAPSLALIVASCGGQAPPIAPAAQYSAEALASEFLFEYKNLKAGAGDPGRASKERPQDTAKAAAKGEAATKGASTATLDGLIAEARRKARGVAGTSPADACKKVAEEVAKDPTIPEADKKAIAEGLGRAD